MGVISVISNIIPQTVHDMTENFFEGKISEATALQLDTLELTSAMFCEVNPIPVKAALNMVGFNAGLPRLPLVELSDSGKDKVRSALKNLNI